MFTDKEKIFVKYISLVREKISSFFLSSDIHVNLFRLVCLKCGHLFGQSCIERWIRTSRQNAKCPQCKSRARLNDIRRLYVRSVKVT